MKLCAIVPSHDHYRAIGQVVRRLREAGLPVFVVDDGSGEPAASTIAALDDPANSIIVRRLPVNQGKGAAVIEGFRLAQKAGFSHALQVDADGQHDLGALPDLIALARTHPEALISGQPAYDDSIPAGRKIGRWITHVWVWIETLSFRISDSMCGFRIYPLAAVTELLAEEKVGRRMDFDTEIMVRLFWRGVPVHMLPVKVIYPPDNTSNFRMIADNVRISWMHTRLVYRMLLRLITPRRHARHWAAIGERGSYWGIRCCAAAYRLFGPRVSKALLAPIVLYFLATGREQRAASRAFLTRALGRPPSFGESFRHFTAFAGRAIDTFAAWIGALPADAVAVADRETLDKAIADPRGALMVIAHIGNVDLARALLPKNTRDRLTLLVHTRHAVHYNRVMSEYRPEAAMNIIQVTEIGPDTAVHLKAKVEDGGWVVIAGDRTPVLSQGRISRVPFFGEPAAFSHGPWILAALLACPVYLLSCLPDGTRHVLRLEPFAEEVVLPRATREAALTELTGRYAARLEQQARQTPFQWFNFFDFWAR